LTEDRALQEFMVEVAVEPLGPTTSINKEAPQGIFNG
jgi:hypothetical protein